MRSTAKVDSPDPFRATVHRATLRRWPHHWSMLMANSMMKDPINITTAMAVAPS